MKRVTPIGLIALAIAALPAPVTAAPALTKKQAITKARAVITAEFDSRSSRPTCKRRTRSAATCTLRWSDGLRRYTGKVTLRRADPPHSPVDRYTLRGKGTARYLSTKRVRRSGRLVVQTRTARLGQPLRLLGIEDTTEVEVTPGQYMDPYPPGEFDTPSEGTRYVALELRVKNLGRERFDTALSNGSRFVLADHTTIEATFASGCSGLVAMAYGEVRIGCVVFEVPFGASIRQFEHGPESGFGQETGVWR